MNNDINLWLGIIGLIASFVFGILSIYQFKSRRYPGKLTFYEEFAIGLFDSLVKNFPQIAIKYENKNIDAQILLLKAFIINTGSIDIKDSLVQEKLSLRLPPGYTWLNAKVTDMSEGANASVEIINNIIYFDLGLFKKNEYIRFEALLQIPLGSDSTEGINKSEEIFVFNHRIADTNEIERRKGALSLPKLFNGINIFLLFMAFFTTFLSVDTFSNLSKTFYGRMQFQYHIKSDSSISVVTAYVKNQEVINTYSLKSKKKQEIPTDEFFNKLVKTEVGKSVSTNGEVIGNFIAIIMLVIMPLAVLYLPIRSFREYRKVKKIRTILNLDKKEKI